ncbi:MAG TPA: hypothetical protein VFX65_06900 [Candidatus Limnocylindrales bacterium]|nr:hypothetical protein [Candidatus Limnocylindrales bacterium]
MTPDISGWFDAIFGIALVGTLITFIVPVAFIVLIVWAIRRNAPARRDPAEEALRDRLASGEIDMAEFQVRLRALRDGEG